MAKLNEQLQALKNEENADQIKEITKSADELHNSNQSLYSRAKKAEGFEQKNGEWVKKPKPVKKIEKPEANKPNESDLSKVLETAQRALLNSSSYKNKEQQDYIFKEAKRLKVDVSEIINDDYHKSKLKAITDKLDVQGNMPKGGGKSGGSTFDSVEYWLAKDELPDNQKLAEKVIEAKMKKETNKKQFSDTLYVG